MLPYIELGAVPFIATDLGVELALLSIWLTPCRLQDMERRNNYEIEVGILSKQRYKGQGRLWAKVGKS